jgi:hypothetical protein
MTKQEAFDRVWDWFVVQGKPRSSNPRGECFYRGDDGAKCAVGVLIPDPEYKDHFEGICAHALIRDGKLPALRNIGLEFIADLQQAHDGSDIVEGYRGIRDGLRDVAERHGLRIPGSVA